MAAPLPRIVPLGDAAVLAEFSDTLDLAVNARIHARSHRRTCR